MPPRWLRPWLIIAAWLLIILPIAGYTLYLEATHYCPVGTRLINFHCYKEVEVK